MVYDRYNYDAEKRDALDRWDDEHERFREADLGHGAATAKIDVRCR